MHSFSTIFVVPNDGEMKTLVVKVKENLPEGLNPQIDFLKVNYLLKLV